jgi:hypothetical protein
LIQQATVGKLSTAQEDVKQKRVEEEMKEEEEIIYFICAKKVKVKT